MIKQKDRDFNPEVLTRSDLLAEFFLMPKMEIESVISFAINKAVESDNEAMIKYLTENITIIMDDDDEMMYLEITPKIAYAVANMLISNDSIEVSETSMLLIKDFIEVCQDAEAHAKNNQANNIIIEVTIPFNRA